jgi:CRISPR/Cas system-associated endonuclease/helicase Cas3
VKINGLEKSGGGIQRFGRVIRAGRRQLNVLGLDGRRELFLLADPGAKALISEQSNPGRSAWNDFVRDDKARKIHNISDEETLSRVSKMGEVKNPRDFLFIRNTIRQALVVY